jgi:hypothetical protein
MAAIITAGDIYAYMAPQLAPSATLNLLLADIAARASGVVNGELYPITFGPYPDEATQELVFSDGTAFLEIPAYQAGTLTEIRAGADDGDIVPTTDYTVRGQLIRLVNYYGYTGFYPNHPYVTPGWGRGPYYVTAKWGYGPAPDEVVQVALEVAINIYQTRESGGLREAASVEGGAVVQQVTGLSRRQLDILARYKARHEPGIVV